MIKTLVRTTFLIGALCVVALPICRINAAETIDGRTNPHQQYRLGPQDKVSIKVYEWRPARDEIYEWTAFKSEYIVNATGSLSLPLLGEVPAQGISTSQLSQDIGDRLKHKMGLIES